MNASRLLLLLVACGASTPDSQVDFVAPEEACERDDECVITDLPIGCCDCCSCSVPYAIRRDALEANREECAAMDCTARHEELECAIVECARCPLTDEVFHAVCESGRCARRSSPLARFTGTFPP